MHPYTSNENKLYIPPMFFSFVECGPVYVMNANLRYWDTTHILISHILFLFRMMQITEFAEQYNLETTIKWFWEYIWCICFLLVRYSRNMAIRVFDHLGDLVRIIALCVRISSLLATWVQINDSHLFGSRLSKPNRYYFCAYQNSVTP